MPLVVNTQPALVRAANTMLSRTFFPRAKDWFYTKLCATSVSTSAVEPYVAIGSVPLLTKYNGFLRSKRIPSYKTQVPNLLFKNLFAIAQEDMEFDQTRSLIQLSAALGVRLAEWPDYLFAKKVIKGRTANTQYVTFKGTQYTMTMDALPHFSTAHTTYDGATQSNIIEGTLPKTEAGILAQDPATTAGQMIRDFNGVINGIRKVKDTAGAPLFPNLDTGKSVVVVVPPILEMAATLAFKTKGLIAGTGGASGSATLGSSVGSSQNVAPMFVKDVISSGLFAYAGFPDPEEDGSTLVQPTNEVEWYAFVVEDFQKPYLFQTYRPPKDDEMFPRGYDAGAVVDKILKADSSITVAQATAFASTRVDTTFNRVGADADAFTIQNEEFLCSGRIRGNIVPGPWFLSWKILPASYT